MPCEILYDYARIYQFRLLTLSLRLNLEPQRCALKIYVIFQMAGRARRGQNERVPPPPPPPPTLQEVMASHHLSTMVVEIISVTPRQLPTRSSSVPSHHCSPGQRTHLMRMYG
jgi:hypothetical protein